MTRTDRKTDCVCKPPHMRGLSRFASPTISDATKRMAKTLGCDFVLRDSASPKTPHLETTMSLTDEMIEAGTEAYFDAIQWDGSAEKLVEAIYLAMHSASPTDNDVERIIEHVRKYDVKESDPRRRFTQAQMETAVRAALQAIRGTDEGLRSALEPFADFGDFLDSETDGFSNTDTLELTINGHHLFDFKVEQFRTAREALSNHQGNAR